MRWATALMRAACASLTASDISRPIMRTRNLALLDLLHHHASRLASSAPPRANVTAA